MALALSTMMFSIGEGIRHSTDELLEGGGIDGYIIAEGGNIFFGTGYFEDGRELAASIDDHVEVNHAIPVLYATVYMSNVQSPTNADNVTDVSAMGLDPALVGQFRATDITTPVHGHKVRSDALPTREDPFHNDWNVQGRSGPGLTRTANFTREVSINRNVAKVLDVMVGDEVFISPTKDMFNAERFDVVEVASPIPEYPWLKGVTLHLSELQYIKNLRNDTVNRIFLDLSSSADSDLKDDIEGEYPVSFVTLDDLADDIGSVTLAFDGYATLIVIITFIVAVMFTSTILIISVRERSVELGALRAMGISRRSILWTVMAESFMITMIGFLIGVVMGYIMAGSLDGFIKSIETGLPTGAQFTLVTPFVLMEVLGIALVVGLTAGIFPAYWITRLNITVVLRGE